MSKIEYEHNGWMKFLKVYKNVFDEKGGYKMAMVAVYEDGVIIATVEYNHRLDRWDGHDFTNGGLGRHLGITKLEDEKVYFFEPLEKEISVEDMQKIVDANEKLVKDAINVGIAANKKNR